MQNPREPARTTSIFDLGHGTSSRLTSDDSWEGNPVWSPDGRHAAFAADLNGPPDIYTLDLASGSPKELLKVDVVMHPVAWSPDGREALFLNEADPSIYVSPSHLFWMTSSGRISFS